MDEPPAQALRYKKDSSMRVAVNLVKSGEAHACVSAGNTGALMAISRFVLKTLAGIDRPAIATVLPNMKGGYTYVLDLGANVDCTPEHLLQFGVMGAMLVAAVEHKERPDGRPAQHRRGGHQGQRGGEAARASCCARAASISGNVEGDDIYKGTTDVVVCDGFVGNVALKASEGVAHDARRLPARGVHAQRPGPSSRRWIAMPVLQGASRAASTTGKLQRREPARPARHRDQEPRLGRRVRVRPGARARARRSRATSVPQRIAARMAQMRAAAARQCAAARCNDLLADRRHRQLPAAAGA